MFSHDIAAEKNVRVHRGKVKKEQEASADITHKVHRRNSHLLVLEGYKHKYNAQINIIDWQQKLYLDLNSYTRKQYRLHNG